jgi:hypothetical protein
MAAKAFSVNFGPRSFVDSVVKSNRTHADYQKPGYSAHTAICAEYRSMLSPSIESNLRSKMACRQNDQFCDECQIMADLECVDPQNVHLFGDISLIHQVRVVPQTFNGRNYRPLSSRAARHKGGSNWLSV